MNEKEIINRLIKIAVKQQKIIKKLAQMNPSMDAEIKSYLKRSFPAAIANAGGSIEFGNITVDLMPGKESGNVLEPETYVVKINLINKIDNMTKQKIIDNYKQQIKSQKPELDGRVSIVFTEDQSSSF